MGHRTAGGMRGLKLTFATLAESREAGAEALLAGALTELDPQVQVGAVEAMLARGGGGGAGEAVASLHLLSSHAVNYLTEHVDEILPVLRELAGSGQVQTRANVVELVARTSRVKLAYLLVGALEDGEERIAERALEGLERLTRRYHQEVEARRKGGEQHAEAQEELEAKRFALIDALLGKLGPIRAGGGGENPERLGRLLELSMGLDGRTDDVIYRILVNPHDGRSRMVASLVGSGCSGQVVSFIVEMLRSRNADKSGRALTLLEHRREADFVRALLGTERLFGDGGGCAKALRELKRIPWLEGYAGAGEGAGQGTEIEAVLGEGVNGIRAIRLLMMSGVGAEEILKGMSLHGPTETVREIAGETLEGLVSGKPREEILAGLVEAERKLGGREEEGSGEGEGRGGGRSLGWARAGTRAIPPEAFREFFREFDRLGPEVKGWACSALVRLDAGLDEELREALGSVEAGARLKAVQIVEALGRERQHEGMLLELGGDPDERVRATAVRALASMGSEPSVRTLVTAATDLDRRVVANAVEGMEATGRGELEGLLRVLARHANNRIRGNAVKALMRMGSAGAQRMLEEMLESPAELMRLSGTWVLGEVDFSGRAGWLRRLAQNDPSEHVRRKAEEILEDMG